MKTPCTEPIFSFSEASSLVVWHSASLPAWQLVSLELASPEKVRVSQVWLCPPLWVRASQLPEPAARQPPSLSSLSRAAPRPLELQVARLLWRRVHALAQEVVAEAAAQTASGT